jgi:hypothetical protein
MQSGRKCGHVRRVRLRSSEKGANRSDGEIRRPIALTCTTSSGGENPGSAGALAVFQTCQTFFEESFSPAADDLASGAQALGNLIIGETLLSEEDHFGAGDNKIR